jgi:hypothetical protein
MAGKNRREGSIKASPGGVPSDLAKVGGVGPGRKRGRGLTRQPIPAFEIIREVGGVEKIFYLQTNLGRNSPHEIFDRYFHRHPCAEKLRGELRAVQSEDLKTPSAGFASEKNPDGDRLNA